MVSTACFEILNLFANPYVVEAQSPIVLWAAWIQPPTEREYPVSSKAAVEIGK